MSKIIDLYRAFGKSRVVLFFLSLRLQVVCLLLLFILVGWGTIYQKDAGLFAAQQKFFYSWFLLAGGFVPLPGAKLVLWVLFLNMILVMLYRIGWNWNKAGMWLVHGGLLFLVAGAGYTHYFSEEAFLSLKEGEGNFGASDYRKWELVLWQEELGVPAKERTITAYQFDRLKLDQAIDYALTSNASPLHFQVQGLAENADPIRVERTPSNLISPSGWAALAPSHGEKDPSAFLPMAQLALGGASNLSRQLLLWGGDTGPAFLYVDGKRVAVQLRKRRLELPAGIFLKSFVAEDHQGTQIAKKYESHVRVVENGHARDAVIRMNAPLRIRDWTFFQSSFQRDAGSVSSVLAITRNGGAAIPYIASAMVFLGLLVHFGIMLYRRLTRSVAPQKNGEAA